MKKIYIYHHLGLGDHISCNGIVRTILKKNKNKVIFLFCKKSLSKIIKFMYRDEKKIKLLPISTKKNTEKEFSDKIEKIIKNLNNKSSVIKIGFEKFDKIYNEIYSYNNPVTYDMVFYHQLNISYKKRFTECYWKRNYIEEKRVYNKLVKDKNSRFAFVHDEPNLGYKIDTKFVRPGLKIIKNDKNENIFNMAKIIEKADELHLMESSIRNMSETLNIKSKNIYLYIWRRRKISPIYSPKLNKIVGSQKNWKIIYMNPKKKNMKFFIMNSLLKARFYCLNFLSIKS